MLSNHKIGAPPVISSGKLTSIITASDLLLPEPRPLPQWAPRGSMAGAINYTADFVVEFESGTKPKGHGWLRAGHCPA
jgi:hypothetical protein